MKQSAGILLYRLIDKRLQVLLVHPGGPYHRNRHIGNWSIPKGEFEPGEEPLAAAKREFQEETGQPLPSETFIPLQPVKQRSGKTVFAWAATGEFDPASLQSNTFRMEYPYKSGNYIEVPEADEAAWFDPETARVRINPGQAALIDELLAILGR